MGRWGVSRDRQALQLLDKPTRALRVAFLSIFGPPTKITRHPVTKFQQTGCWRHFGRHGYVGLDICPASTTAAADANPGYFRSLIVPFRRLGNKKFGQKMGVACARHGRSVSVDVDPNVQKKIKWAPSACTPPPLKAAFKAMFCFVLFVLPLSVLPQWASATTAGPFPTWNSGLRLKKLVAALPLRPSRTANADGL